MLANHRFTNLPAYTQLQAHYDSLKDRHLRDMFAEDHRSVHHIHAPVRGHPARLSPKTASPAKPLAYWSNWPNRPA